jgi:hypothetical protein
LGAVADQPVAILVSFLMADAIAQPTALSATG